MALLTSYSFSLSTKAIQTSKPMFTVLRAGIIFHDLCGKNVRACVLSFKNLMVMQIFSKKIYTGFFILHTKNQIFTVVDFACNSIPKLPILEDHHLKLRRSAQPF
jgi:hypothetical protein